MYCRGTTCRALFHVRRGYHKFVGARSPRPFLFFEVFDMEKKDLDKGFSMR
jgi:hypothetical protein